MRARYSKLVYDKNIDDAMIRTFVSGDDPPSAIPARRSIDNPKALRTWLPYFERLIEKRTWSTGDSFADALVFDMVDSHLRVDPDCLRGLPALGQAQREFAALPGVAAYLAGPKRRARANGASAAFDTPEVAPTAEIVYAADGTWTPTISTPKHEL